MLEDLECVRGSLSRLRSQRLSGEKHTFVQIAAGVLNRKFVESPVAAQPPRFLIEHGCRYARGALVASCVPGVTVGKVGWSDPSAGERLLSSWA